MTAHDGRYCTGTLVLSNVVLTAAHCLEGVRPEQMRISIGDSHRQVDRYLVHPDYHPGRSPAPDPADIALLSFAPTSDPLPMSAISPREIRRGEEVTFVGFGDSRTTRASEPLFKRVGSDRFMPGNGVSASGVENSVAATERGRGLLYFESGPSDVGVSRFGAAATRGDSGGPLFGEHGAIVGVLIAVSQVQDAQNPHRVTWAVDISSPSVRVFLEYALFALAAPGVV